MKKPFYYSAFLIMMLMGCSAQAQFNAELYNDGFSAKVSAEPQVVDPAHDLMVTITVKSAANLKIELPDLQNRFQGFSMAEDFTTEPVEAGGQIMISQRWKLTPRPAATRYRLAPFALTVIDNSVVPPQVFTVATRPVVFPRPKKLSAVAGEPEVTVEPEWIAPTAGTIALWIIAGAGALVIFVFILYALTRISARVREFRMSPIDRAMTELDRLMRRRLPEKGLFKDFYIELTMVVRRYIERSHNVRAPEQTTEEFLAAAAAHPGFTGETLENLKTFLESADLVKFAGQQADIDMTEQAVERARDYLNSDVRNCTLDEKQKNN